MFGLTTTKPLRGGSSRQSIVAPRSFSTLSAATTMARSPSCWTVSPARTLAAVKRQRAAVFAVGSPGDPHRQDAFGGFAIAGAEAASALERDAGSRAGRRCSPRIYDSGVARLLLILPSATYRAPDFMAAARELGVAVTVASDRRAAMSAAMGDRALTLRLSDPAGAAEQIADRARDTPFAAIVGVDDQGVMAAALGAERLGLAHNPPAPSPARATRRRCAGRSRQARCPAAAIRVAALRTPTSRRWRATWAFPAWSSRWRCRAAAA